MNLNTCFFSGSSTCVNCHHRSLQGWSCPWEEKVCGSQGGAVVTFSHSKNSHVLGPRRPPVSD